MDTEQTSRGAGRPTVMTDEVVAAILGALRVGAHLESAAKAAGISRRTLFQHRRDNPDFRTRVMRAVAEGENELVRKIQSSDQWQSAAWLLERRHNQRWGKKDRVDVTSGDKPIQVVDKATWDKL